jgi:hypothetical protein
LRILADSSAREPTLKTYGFVAAVGLILGFAMVWWVEPQTNAGAVFIVVATALICFVGSFVLSFIGRLFPKEKSKNLHSAPSSRTTLGLVGGELLAWTVDGGWY